jgi:alpha-L-fucosidase
VDVVSKNGNLLLNVGPKADGTISNEATGILRGLGAWLKVNAEAIYDTQHWHIYGEGSTKVESGQMTERKNKPFTARDVRFTTKDDALYAICMGWPDNKINIKSLKKGSPVSTERIAQITMLGSEEGLEWSQDEAGLQIKAPASKPCDHAYTYKIVLKD